MPLKVAFPALLCAVLADFNCMLQCVLLHTGSPCDQAAKMLPPPKPAPQVQLLPAAGPIYIEYGTPTHVSLAPCLTGNASSSYGAVAWDVAPSRRTDLTPYLAVASAPSCSSDSSGPQVRCGAAAACICGCVLCVHTVFCVHI